MGRSEPATPRARPSPMATGWVEAMAMARRAAGGDEPPDDDAGLASSRIGSQRTPTCVPSGIFFAPLAATGTCSWLRVAAIGSGPDVDLAEREAQRDQRRASPAG